MQWPGRLLVKMRDDDCCESPAHLDVLSGARRPDTAVDLGGPIDQTILRRASAMHVCCPFHAKRSLHRVGHRHSNFNQLERDLGMARTRAVSLAEPEQARAIVNDLRSLDGVEWAVLETLSVAPLHARPETAGSHVTQAMIFHPHQQVGAPEALSMVYPGRQLRVAVIDTGVSLYHAELSGRLGSGFDTVDLGTGSLGEGITLVGDSSHRDNHPMDITGHGTHVAGILGARGVHLPPGICGDSEIIPVRALAAATAGGGRVFGVGGLLDIDAGIKAAVDAGASVMNMSFGTPADALDPDAPPPHSDVIEYALANNAIPVAAMGNSGEYEDYFPAALPGVISVGSVNAENKPSDFSTRGPHVDIAAPGEAVISLGLEGYKESTGTSHATPFVAGAVALMVERANRRGHTLTIDLARRALRESATSRPADVPDPAIGHGVLNIPGALRQLDQILSTMENGNG